MESRRMSGDVVIVIVPTMQNSGIIFSRKELYLLRKYFRTLSAICFIHYPKRFIIDQLTVYLTQLMVPPTLPTQQRKRASENPPVTVQPSTNKHRQKLDQETIPNPASYSGLPTSNYDVLQFFSTGQQQLGNNSNEFMHFMNARL